MKPFFRTFALLAMLTSCVPQEHAARAIPNPSQNTPIMKEARPQNEKGIPDNATPIKVALLLPLSGDSAPVGNMMLDAATMAIYDQYMSYPAANIHSQIVLIPKDTGVTPAQTVAAADQAIAQGASYIVGPLFSQSVIAMRPTLASHHMGAISFSNNRDAASPGIYTFGFMPEQQISRMAEFAYLHNIQRVGVLAPNDAYGQKVRDELSAAFTQKGGTASPAELYAPSPANIDAAVTRMMAAYNNMAEERRFQAIFIGDSGYNIKNIVESLKRNNVDLKKIKLLGASMWDDPEIAKIPEMQGAWFPSSPPEPYATFEHRFTAMYGYKPNRLASLSYDAVAFLISQSINGQGGKINTANFTNSEGFIGPANGLFRLNANGTSERKLSIMEVTPGGFKVFEPSSKSFTLGGSR